MQLKTKCSKKMKNPIIGITCDYLTKPTYSKYPWYAIRENYISSLAKHGAIVLPLHYDFNNITTDILSKLDGVLVTGGDFDINPSMYGDHNVHQKTSLNSKRTENELKILNFAVDKNLPILGICGGMQLINVFFKGSLIQHIPDYIKTSINHEQENPRNEAGHFVLVEENTKLYSAIGGKSKIAVNSAHHQAVLKPGNNILINAYSEKDGIIEGIEHKDMKFCVGVQYHPEFEITTADTNLLASFVKACI